MATAPACRSDRPRPFHANYPTYPVGNCRPSDARRCITIGRTETGTRLRRGVPHAVGLRVHPRRPVLDQRPECSEEAFDVVGRAAESERCPDGTAGATDPREQRVRAETAVADADAVLGGQVGGDVAGLVT